MGVGVYQQVIDVDDHVLEVPEYALHESLKGSWAAQQSHWRGDPVELSFPGYSEGWDFSSNFICQNPEVRSSVEKMLEFALPMSLMHSVSPSSSTCQCGNSGSALGSLARSGVLILVSWARRKSVSCRASPISGLLLILAILLGFVL
jgi:hypothetical protein